MYGVLVVKILLVYSKLSSVPILFISGRFFLPNQIFSVAQEAANGAGAQRPLLPNQIFSVAQEAANRAGAQRPLRGGRQEEKRTREPAGTNFCSSDHFLLNNVKIRALITTVVFKKLAQIYLLSILMVCM
jgi:hypothetical protein